MENPWFSMNPWRTHGHPWRASNQTQSDAASYEFLSVAPSLYQLPRAAVTNSCKNLGGLKQETLFSPCSRGHLLWRLKETMDSSGSLPVTGGSLASPGVRQCDYTLCPCLPMAFFPVSVSSPLLIKTPVIRCRAPLKPRMILSWYP